MRTKNTNKRPRTKDLGPRTIHVIAHDIRSRENVGMLFRSLEFLGVEKLWLTGFTPSPRKETSSPRGTADSKIEKIALGAEKTLEWEAVSNVDDVISQLKKDNVRIAALEITDDAVEIQDYDAPDRLAILLGREVEGISPSLLTKCDDVVQIPRRGQKESLNVAFAAAIAAYELLKSY